MKRSLLVILMLLLACSFANADDYIRIDVDSIVSGSTGLDMEFYVTRECPTPAMITGTSNGFVINMASTATFNFNSFTADPTAAGWFNLGGLLFTDGLTGETTSGQFLTGGAAMPPMGMPIVTEQLYFTLNMDIFADAGDDAAALCIDSQFVFAAGAWKFSGMTCGDEPGNENRPKFLAHDFSDAVHPICLKIYELQCTNPTINVTPIGDQLVGNHCDGLAFSFGADAGTFGLDPATIVGWNVTAGLGTIDGAGNYTVGAQPSGTYSVTVEVENDCGLTDDYTFGLVFTNQAPSIVNCAGMPGAISSGNTYTFDFNASDPNASCDVLSWSVVGGGVNPATIDATGNFSWVTDPGDAGGTFSFTVTVADDQVDPLETLTDDCSFDVEVTAGGKLVVVLEKDEGDDDYVDCIGAFQGHYTNVSIFLAANAVGDLGGYDFLVAYDASALTFQGAVAGQALVNAGWEYFTYRFGAWGNCDGPCPSGMLRVVAMAELNNGPAHPNYFGLASGINKTGELAELTFYVTNDRTYECQFVPIQFWWFDCGDNAISDKDGNILYIARETEDGTEVYNFYEWYGDLCGTYDLTNNYRRVECAPTGPQFLCGPPEELDCYNVDTVWNADTEQWIYKGAIGEIDFYNGGVDIACADEIDARGDLNLNNVSNEIADAVLYTNYFIQGLGAFTIRPEGQIAASDVNNDGKVLTVGDLVYLIRVITGDALPFPKLSPFADNVEVTFDNIVSTNSSADIGAALFVFDGSADVELLADGMEMKSGVVDGQTRVLVWSSNTNRIPAGENSLVAVNGDVTLVESSFSDYYGNLMNVAVAKVLPDNFALKQNFPNPFNPSTDITIVLPEQSQWKLDIYNITGQLVKTFSGNNIGEVTVTWDASNVASGIYFYKATAGKYTDTKKMVLMK